MAAGDDRAAVEHDRLHVQERFGVDLEPGRQQRGVGGGREHHLLGQVDAPGRLPLRLAVQPPGVMEVALALVAAEPPVLLRCVGDEVAGPRIGPSDVHGVSLPGSR